VTFVEVKWLRTKVAMSALVGAILCLAVFTWVDRSAGVTRDSRLALVLTADNNVLRQQIERITPEVSRLEQRTQRLDDHVGELLVRVQRSPYPEDPVMRFTAGASLNSLSGNNPRSVHQVTP
jgi:hypothetical protein